MSEAATVGPSAVIARRAFRSTVTGAAAFAAVGASTIASTALTYVTTFPTSASRRALATLTDGGAGLSVLFGPTDAIDTVGGYTFYKGYVFLTAIGAVWAVLATTRVLRGEEDAGRWQLLLAGATRPARATAATLAGVAASIALVTAGVAIGTAAASFDGRVGFGPTDVALHAASLGSVVAVFGALAAVASQLGRTRRVASAVGLGLVGAMFALRMVGDAGAATRWVRWTTPFGWAELVAPLTDNRWAPLVPAVLLTLAATAGAIALSARRDVGDGLLGRSDTATMRGAGLGSVSGLALRLERGALVAWLVGALALGASFGIVAHLTTTSLPDAARAMLERFGAGGSFTDQYVGTVMLFVAAVLALLPAGQVAAAAEEEAAGRTALLLAGPTLRRTWLLGRLALAVAGLVAAAAVTGTAMWGAASAQGTDLGFGSVVGAALNVVPVCLVALGIGAVVLAVAPRWAAGTIYVVVGWSLVADIVGSLVADARWVGRLGLLHYLTLVPAQPADIGGAVLTALTGLALSAAAVVLFSRRDLGGL